MRKLVPLLFLLGCAQDVPPVRPVPGRGYCDDAEEQLLRLGCKDGRGRPLGGPNLRGEPFRDICRNALENAVDLNPKCIAAAGTCTEANRCSR